MADSSLPMATSVGHTELVTPSLKEVGMGGTGGGEERRREGVEEDDEVSCVPCTFLMGEMEGVLRVIGSLREEDEVEVGVKGTAGAVLTGICTFPLSPNPSPSPGDIICVLFCGPSDFVL